MAKKLTVLLAFCACLLVLPVGVKADTIFSNLGQFISDGEPSSLFLLGTGIAGLAAFLSRRRNAKRPSISTLQASANGASPTKSKADRSLRLPGPMEEQKAGEDTHFFDDSAAANS